MRCRQLRTESDSHRQRATSYSREGHVSKGRCEILDLAAERPNVYSQSRQAPPALRRSANVLSKTKECLAPPERSDSLVPFWSYKHSVPLGLKTESVFVTRTLETRLLPRSLGHDRHVILAAVEADSVTRRCHH